MSEAGVLNPLNPIVGLSQPLIENDTGQMAGCDIKRTSLPTSNRILRLFKFLHWKWKNRNNCKCGGQSTGVTINPQSDDIHDIWSIIVEAKQLEKTEDELANFVYQLLYKVLVFLGFPISKEYLVRKDIEIYLAQGYCFGISREILRQLMHSSTFSFDKIKRIIDYDKITALQILSFADVGVRIGIDEREQVIAMLRARNCPSDPNDIPKFLKDLEVPAKYIKEWEENTLQDQIQEGNRLLTEIQQATDRISQMMISQTIEWTVDDPTSYLSRLRETFMGAPQKNFFVNCFPPEGTDIPGHAMMIDFENNCFYDINIGFYKYDDRESLVNAFIEHLTIFYPPYIKKGAQCCLESNTSTTTT